MPAPRLSPAMTGPLTCLAFGLLGLGVPVAPALGGDLGLTGLQGQRATLTAADLDRLAQVSVRLNVHGRMHRFEGPLLIDVLAAVGAPRGSDLRGADLADAILVRAADGYEVALGLAEADPGVRSNRVILADREDGAALPPADGPLGWWSRATWPASARGAPGDRDRDYPPGRGDGSGALTVLAGRPCSRSPRGMSERRAKRAGMTKPEKASNRDALHSQRRRHEKRAAPDGAAPVSRKFETRLLLEGVVADRGEQHVLFALRGTPGPSRPTRHPGRCRGWCASTERRHGSCRSRPRRPCPRSRW